MIILVDSSQELSLLSFFIAIASHSVQFVIKYFILGTVVLVPSADLLPLVDRVKSIIDNVGTIPYIILALMTNT